jgi:hypothetical protein
MTQLLHLHLTASLLTALLTLLLPMNALAIS